MPSLKSLQVKLQHQFPSYEIKHIEVNPFWGYPHLRITKGNRSRALVLTDHKTIQILPVGLGFGERLSSFFKNKKTFREVGIEVEIFLSTHMEKDVILVKKINNLERSAKGKRADNFVQIFVGILFFVLAAYSYFEIRKIERLGEGEDNLEDLIYLLYMFLGKNGTVILLVAVGLYFIIESIWKLSKTKKL